ncbi:MAG: hypothetical protein ACXWZ1_07240 [Gaiellaceae bacterium]
MKKSALVLAAFAALACLSAGGPLAAAGAAEKTPLTITLVGKTNGDAASGKFNLIGASAAYADSGRFTHSVPVESLSRKTSDGLSYVVIQRTETLKGRRGTLVIRSSVRRFDVVEEDDSVSTGTWSIVRGTGRYAGLKGRGALVGITQFATNATNFTEYEFSFRYAGLIVGA